MKKIIMTLVMALVMTGAAFAGDNNHNAHRQDQRPDAAQMAQQMTDRMASRYGLDEKQTASLLELNKEYAGKMPMMGGRHGGKPGGRPGFPGGRPDRNGGCQCGNQPEGTPADSAMARPPRPSKEEMEQRQKEMESNREAYNAGVKKIMTSKQYKQYEEDQKNIRNHRKGNSKEQ